jgi:hypothetical protein
MVTPSRHESNADEVTKRHDEEFRYPLKLRSQILTHNSSTENSPCGK